jgi:hypothetical protein
MKINQLLTTLLAMAPSTALSAILTSGVPEEHAPAVKKVVGALCSETQESDKPFVVSLGDDSFYCDEASTGLVANAAMAGIDESLMPSRRKNQLRVKGQAREGWVSGIISAVPFVIGLVTQDKALSERALSESDFSSILSSILPDSWLPSIQKVAGALCDVAEDSGLPYVVSLADNSWFCDEESTGLLANTAAAAMEESVTSGWLLKKHLAVQGQGHAKWGNWQRDVGTVVDTTQFVISLF